LSEDIANSDLRRALLDAAADRPFVGGETDDDVREAAERIADLLLSVEPPERWTLLDEAMTKLVTPGASLRKLEKRIRQAALGAAGSERARAAVELAPDIRIDDLRGTVRFSLMTEEKVQIESATYTVPVTARILGGPLERTLLTAGPEQFVAEARPLLEAELERAVAETRDAAAAIDDIVRERAARPLYDVRGMRRIVMRAIRDEEDMAAALEQIEYQLRPLDREAEERERVRVMVEERGLIAYREYFPTARSLHRELVFYAGPTNSGKTWRALNDLVASGSGAYLAPLRLLALEGQEEIEKRGAVSSFLTGEERDIREGAPFIASTIEMMDPRRVVDTVVIDEVQLLTDRDRGWAWCQALVGAPARRVIMTGSPDAIPLVQAMADYLEEPLTVHLLERHTPIEALPQPMSLAEIEPGTAVIAFTRRDVLAIKADLEAKFRVAVIYGNLTPEVRREEARRFRSGEAQVLVSTDAIAMGLNLPIETVCFSTLQKWNGQDDVQLEPWEILQIGGRAGRFGKYERGYVGALDRRDARRIVNVFAPGFEPPHRDIATTVRPGTDHIAVIAEGLHTKRLSRALTAFQRGMTFDSPLLSPGVQDDMIELAELADRHRTIPLAERLTLASAPVDMRLDWLIEEYGIWMGLRATNDEVHLEPLSAMFQKERAAGDEELRSAEGEAKRLTLYAWLAYRFPETFPDLAHCTAQRRALDSFIERSLAAKRTKRRTTCEKCGRPLGPRNRHARCLKCAQGADGGRKTRTRRRA
jgi:ATP-dependent RNA helicase SUPV3L1/SUV3